MSRVAVVDIGKTNAKLAVVDTDRMAEIDVLTRPNRPLHDGPYPHFDIDGIWAFLCDGLGALHRRHGLDAISVTTHGAALVLLDRDGGLACPVLDYEHDGPDRLAAAYGRLRPPFGETGSPRLPLGLNAGAQLHWLLETQPGLAARLGRIVTYPQFWSGRLAGPWHCECTSLGCHTDLWNPHAGTFSTLVDRLGLGPSMAPLERAAARLGPLLPEVAAATGLPADTPVHCGIHDSNASLLPHLLARDGPFAVVSTGTWVVAMAVGAGAPPLDPARDTLVNVDAFGAPTPSARFMGGRAFELLRGETAPPGADDVAAALAGRCFLLPSVEGASGPFPGQRGGWSMQAAAPGEKGAALAFYLALMTAECLALIGAVGRIVVEGPFGRNALFLDMLAASTGRPVFTSATATGTSIGAALLGAADPRPPALTAHRLTGDGAALRAYARAWRDAVGPEPGATSSG